MTGPLVEKDGVLYLGTIGMTTGTGFAVRNRYGDPMRRADRTLTVVSRVPRPKPMFVNSDRKHLVPGDIVNYPPMFGGHSRTPFVYARDSKSTRHGRLTHWLSLPGLVADPSPESYEGRYTLLIDGTAGLPPEKP